MLIIINHKSQILPQQDQETPQIIIQMTNMKTLVFLGVDKTHLSS